ncbi:MAG TPA: YraN family protein [Actinomycetota bacterium]|jgi:putative endonuclease
MAVHAIVDRSSRGRDGEDAALRVYLRRGFRPIARNWRCPLGELDLVLERGGLLVFCEVKTRSGVAFGGGYEAVTWSKRRKLRQLAEAFVAARPSAHSGIRFDVASVWLGGVGADVEIFEDAF